MSAWQNRYQRLLFDRPHPKVLRVTMNRPEKYNATDAVMHRELVDVWRDIDGDDTVNCVILQGAGTGILDNGLRGLSGVQIPAVVVTMGTKDGNRGEIKQLRETQGDRLQVFEFEGGHQWAPKAIVEKALDYVHAKLPK